MSDYIVSFNFDTTKHLSQYYHRVSMYMNNCLFPGSCQRYISDSRLINNTTYIHLLMTKLYGEDIAGCYWFTEDEFAILMLSYSNEIQYYHKKDELQSLADTISDLIKQTPTN